MTPEIRTSRNWQRGFHRLFALACVGWAFFFLLVFPLQKVSRAQDLVAQSPAFEAAYSAGTPEARAEAERELKKALREATLPYFYRHEMLPHWPGVLTSLVLPPVVFYGLVRGIIAVTVWVLRGFRA
jgi:hypothetical protein